MNSIVDEPLILAGKLGLAVCFLILISFFGRKFVDRLAPMPVSPVQTLLLHIFIFTCGAGMLSGGGTIGFLFGAAVSLLGLSPFLPERAVIRLFGIFVLLLGLSLGTFLESGFDLFLRPQKPTEFGWTQSVTMIFWGLGVIFAWRRWQLGGRLGSLASGIPPPDVGSRRPS
jgi:hypothetical protein